MNPKLKSTLSLVAIFLLIVIAGSIYTFVIQSGKIKEKQKQLDELKLNQLDTETLLQQLEDLKDRSALLDSILASRKFNVPKLLHQSRFYDFINNLSPNFSEKSVINIEYVDQHKSGAFSYYVYKLTGKATYNDLFTLFYAIEQSKELKKIESSSMDSQIEVDEEGIPHFLVNYTVVVNVYFSDKDLFAASTIVENKLIPNRLYDIFYPLIRNEIPPNKDNLLDVQTARLLALIPDGAFLTDAKGGTYLLWEGDQVYLGYLTKIDYQKNAVSFILNKGGIVENVVLNLEKEKITESK